jgi:hypothetical protein
VALNHGQIREVNGDEPQRGHEQFVLHELHGYVCMYVCINVCIMRS